jgi:hypothetical protein
MEQIGFERQLARRRLILQEQALELQAERIRLLAEAQAVRLGTHRKPVILWVFNGISWTIGKVFENAQRLLR